VEPVLVVGAAVLRERDGRREVLAAQRAEPRELAGLWEFPGGKVEPGETPVGALVRECEEELGLTLAVGERVGPDVVVAGGRFLLQVHLATVVAGTLALVDHTAARWLDATTLHDVAWIEADAPVVAAVAALL
jgi:8-oxo-dGTP diphosphatase